MIFSFLRTIIQFLNPDATMLDQKKYNDLSDFFFKVFVNLKETFNISLEIIYL